MEKKSDDCEFVREISAAMKTRQLSIRDVAKRAGVTYEHVRRIVRGGGVPQNPLLRVICDILDLNYEQMLLLRDELKYADKLAHLVERKSGRKASMDGLDAVWELLSSDQQKDLVEMGRRWAERNRGAKIA
ncbi:MAG: helix-turn-helix domain-containing protein [Bryobacteraceae bacterium]